MSPTPPGRAAAQARTDMQSLLAELVVEPVTAASAAQVEQLAKGADLQKLRTKVDDVLATLRTIGSSASVSQAELQGAEGEPSLRELAGDLLQALGNPESSPEGQNLHTKADGVSSAAARLESAVSELDQAISAIAEVQTTNATKLGEVSSELCGDGQSATLRAMVEAVSRQIGVPDYEVSEFPASGSESQSVHAKADRIASAAERLESSLDELGSVLDGVVTTHGATSTTLGEVAAELRGDGHSATLREMVANVARQIGDPQAKPDASSCFGQLNAASVERGDQGRVLASLAGKLEAVSGILGVDKPEDRVATHLLTLSGKQSAVAEQQVVLADALRGLPAEVAAAMKPALEKWKEEVTKAAADTRAVGVAVGDHLFTTTASISRLATREASVELAAAEGKRAADASDALVESLRVTRDANAAIMTRLACLEREFTLFARDETLAALRHELMTTQQAAQITRLAVRQRSSWILGVCVVAALASTVCAVLIGLGALR